MNYTIMVHETSDGFSARDEPGRMEDYWRGTMQYLKALKDAGVFVSGAGLMPPTTGTTLRFRDGRAVVQDGPIADVKEQLGGFFVVSVENLDRALEWAARFPQRPGIVIEVRPNVPTD